MTDDQPAPPGEQHAKPDRRPPMTRQDAPSHPVLAATLLMLGVVAFLILVSVIAVL